MKFFFPALFITGFASLFLTGCAQSSASTRSVIRYGYTPPAEQAAAALHRTTDLQAYLSKKTGHPVEVTQTHSYGPMIEAMCAGRIDAATMGPFSYIIASNKGCANVLAMAGTSNHEPASYVSVIAVNPKTGITSLEELKKHAHELTFAFNDPASTSGHLVPRAELESMGIMPERDFKKLTYSMSHVVTALSLKADKVDAAAMMGRVLTLLQQRGKMQPGDVHVVWTSDPIPSSPVAVRKGFSSSLAKKLQKAFVDMSKDDPQLMAEINATTASKYGGYIAANDKLFDPLRTMARNVPNIQLLEK